MSPVHTSCWNIPGKRSSEYSAMKLIGFHLLGWQNFTGRGYAHRCLIALMVVMGRPRKKIVGLFQKSHVLALFSWPATINTTGDMCVVSVSAMILMRCSRKKVVGIFRDDADRFPSSWFAAINLTFALPVCLLKVEYTQTEFPFLDTYRLGWRFSPPPP